MKLGMMTHFDPRRPSDGKIDLKNQDGGQSMPRYVDSAGEKNRYGADANMGAY